MASLWDRLIEAGSAKDLRPLARIGYAVVPREPNPAILGAGLAAIQQQMALKPSLTHGEALQVAYRAMIDMAAPKGEESK